MNMAGTGGTQEPDRSVSSLIAECQSKVMQLDDMVGAMSNRVQGPMPATAGPAEKALDTESYVARLNTLLRDLISLGEALDSLDRAI